MIYLKTSFRKQTKMRKEVFKQTEKQYFSKIKMCYAMRINCLTQKELTYCTLTSPQKAQTNKTQYVEAN